MVNYSLAHMSSKPGDESAPKLFYAKAQAAGKIVRLENFGSFQLQLCSTGADTEKKFTSSNITGASIQFRPGKPIKAATRAGDGGLTFKRVAKKGDAPLPDDGGGNQGGNGGNQGGSDGDQGENPLG